MRSRHSDRRRDRATPGTMPLNALERLAETAARLAAPGALVDVLGTVSAISPTTYRVRGLSPFVRLGDCVATAVARDVRHGEVIRIEADAVTVKPYGALVDVGLGSSVVKADGVAVAPTPSWRGRIVDALGRPLDGLGALETGPEHRLIHAEPPPALGRNRVKEFCRTGVRVLDIFTPLCHGQRVGIFAGSGVGKSTLLGMMAGCKGFDTVVIALVGERGSRSARVPRGLARREQGAGRHGGGDGRRQRADAQDGAADGDDDRRELSRPRGQGPADGGQRHALCPCRARRRALRRRTAGGAGLRAQRLHRSAQVARAGRARARGLGLDHRPLRRARRWRRPQRPCRRLHPRHARWARRPRSRHRGLPRATPRSMFWARSRDSPTRFGRPISARSSPSCERWWRDTRAPATCARWVDCKAASTPISTRPVALTPLIYEALTQGAGNPSSTDAFRELAEALNRTRS